MKGGIILTLGSIDLSLKVIRPQLFVALPSRTIIGKLKEAYNINYNVLLGKVNELSFTIPYEIDSQSRIVAMSFCEPRSCIGRLSS